MDPQRISRIISEHIEINNGFLFESKVPYTCPRCRVCGETAVVELEQYIIDAIRNYEFDDLEHDLDADAVILIRSGTHPECYRKVGYVPSQMASDAPEPGDVWGTGDLAYMAGYFDSVQRNSPPISEGDR